MYSHRCKYVVDTFTEVLRLEIPLRQFFDIEQFDPRGKLRREFKAAAYSGENAEASKKKKGRIASQRAVGAGSHSIVCGKTRQTCVL